jgi:hypothetical protein
VREKPAQLEWEARAGKVAGAMAFAASALIILGIAYRVSEIPASATNVKELLTQVNKDESAFLVASILTALAILAIIPPLLYLYRTTRYRRPQIPRAAELLVIAGPVVLAVVTVLLQLKQADAASDFVNGAVKTNKHAEDLRSDAYGSLAYAQLAGSMASGAGVLMLSINAMRAGLLSRFMGILGVILGALFVIPILPAPIIQLFWLTALGVLFIDQWPATGRGPAWESGEEEPWPTAQDRMAEAQAAEEQPALAGGAGPESEPAKPNPRASRKRKKKKSRR